MLPFLRHAMRHLRRHSGYTLLNVLGLTAGFAASLLILLYIHHELSYDKYHEKRDRIYRVAVNFYTSSGEKRVGFSRIAPPFTLHAREDIPQIEAMARVYMPGTALLANGDRSYFVEDMALAESELFQILTLPLLAGQTTNILDEPNTIVLNEKAAMALFGSVNIVGKQVMLDNNRELTVTGVMKNMPVNGHRRWEVLGTFDLAKYYIGNMEDYHRIFEENYSNNITHTYLLLREGHSPEKLQADMEAMIDRRRDWHNRDGDSIQASKYYHPFLQPITSIHLHSHQDGEAGLNGDARLVLFFAIVAGFILLIASINFINLTTARSITRAREIGMRKVSGAQKWGIVSQFLAESSLVLFLSLFLAFLMVWALLPAFGRFVDRPLEMAAFADPLLPLIVAATLLVTTLATGLLPGVLASRYTPSEILRGTTSRGKGGNLLRRLLVITQFTITIALLCSMSVVYSQMRHLKLADMGFDREQVVIYPAVESASNQWDDIKARLLRIPGVVSVTGSRRIPTGRLSDWWGFSYEKDGVLHKDGFRLPNHRVDPDFLKTYGIKVVAGRDFDATRTADFESALIINEAASRAMGFESPQEVVNLPFKYGGGDGTIIGVMDDFHFESLHHEVLPMIMYLTDPETYQHVSIRLAPGDPQPAIQAISEIWKGLRPGYPIRWKFLDDEVNHLYQSEERMMTMIGGFSLLAVLLAGLGLIGISSFSVARRRRELGIRKSLGATVTQLVVLLTREAVWLVLAGGVIAIPLAWYGLDLWLQEYAYRITIHAWMFISAAGFALLLAIGAVLSQTLRAANTNPSIVLRQE